MVSKRYIRPEEKIGVAIQRTRDGLQDAQRPTGTERARTKVVAEQAATDSTFAKDLAQQLETELGPLPGAVQDALDDAAQALSEAGLARSEAATAISDAQQAVADYDEAALRRILDQLLPEFAPYVASPDPVVIPFAVRPS